MTAKPIVLDPPRGCTNFKLRQITRRVSRHYDAAVSASGLKTTQYSLLSHVASLGPVRPSDLAAAMKLDASTLTRNLQPLVAQGWVELSAGVDARSRLVSITEAGRVKRAETQRLWKQAQTSFNEQLGIERVARLHALLDECMALMQDDEGNSDE
ncbi:MarR family winged helix-turn-helix transcriptional regulator [Sphaerotilaceae bacterium SBD11-9]